MKLLARSALLAFLFGPVAPHGSATLVGQELENGVFHYALIEADASRATSATTGRWEGSGWIGTDFDRFWWNTSGEVDGGGLYEAEAMLLYGHYARRFWDLVGGYRHDFEPTSQG